MKKGGVEGGEINFREALESVNSAFIEGKSERGSLVSKNLSAGSDSDIQRDWTKPAFQFALVSATPLLQKLNAFSFCLKSRALDEMFQLTIYHLVI